VTSATFDLFPAIDLRGGRVVRLVEGDFDRETAYSDDPVSVATDFAAAGASWLHVVDLDAAKSGKGSELGTVEAILAAVGHRLRVQVAGGVRSETAAAARLDAGAARIVVGTAALRDPSFARRLVERFGPERVVAAVDVRDGRALGDGWVPGATGVDATTALRRLADASVTTFAVTGIDRDGRLEGPDLRLLIRMVALGRGAIIASGGIATADDIERVRAIGCAGAIVGRALYDGRIDLPAALAAAS
jgi:phosphoribosylformimino-5-aminoimidazole carboxamide ribotide isomerase